MASLPPLLPTPPASLKLRDTDDVDSRAPKRHRPLESPASGNHRGESNSPPSSRRRAGRSPPPPPSKVRRRSRSPPPSKVRRRSRSPPPSEFQRRSRSPPPSKVRRRSRSPRPSKVRRPSRSPPPSKVRRRSRSPPYVSVTRRLAELQPAKRPSAEAAVEGERGRPSLLDELLVENQASHSHRDCKHPETSSAAVEKRPDPAIRGDEQKLDSESMDGKNQSDDKVKMISCCVQAPSRSARRKKMKRQICAEAKKEMREAPSRNDRRKKMKRQIWAEAKKEFREMKKDKLLENIKKLQACIWLLEKDGADMAEIMEFRSLLESTKKQYVENEAQLAKKESGGPLQMLNRDRLEKTHVETMAAPVGKVERDLQNMDSGKVVGRSLKGCEVVSERNELAEEVNCLKSELETVRRDRDYQLAQVQSLMADVGKQKEVARRYGVELEDAMRRVSTLEEGCLLQRETIKALQIHLASANEKLTVPPPTRD